MPLIVALVIFELVVMVLSISLHDAAQAWVASRLGDPTARMMGRLTMNPARHFDLFGMAIWPLLYIFFTPLVLGWGKPVTMTPRNFRNPSRDEMVATLSGPAAQLLAAVVALIILVVLRHTQADTTVSLMIARPLAQRNLSVPTAGLPAIFPLILFLYFCILVNLLLFVFNLLPLPFLDGGKVLMHYLPYNAAQTFQRMGIYLMFAFLFLGFGIIIWLVNPLLSLFNQLLFVL
ncbi:MAG TPA: site-2 protease family protein [Acidobacteriaceae bacterium]|jgi:Zn-dependent protease|nr:site-2 protease family protein [Acidobacteriaceae bacterium]